MYALIIFSGLLGASIVSIIMSRKEDAKESQ